MIIFSALVVNIAIRYNVVNNTITLIQTNSMSERGGILLCGFRDISMCICFRNTWI